MENKKCLIIGLIVLFLSGVCWASSSEQLKEFTLEGTHDFPIRTIRPLEISNARGSVSIQGWSLDKIKVKVRKKIRAKTSEEALSLSKSIHFRTDLTSKAIEIATQYGKELSIEERFKERVDPRVIMEMEIYAPSTLSLKVWSIAGRTHLKNWSSSVEIRSNSGAIEVENVKGERLSTLCENCETVVQVAKSQDLRVISRDGGINLNQVQSKDIYVESDQGRIQLLRLKGSQLYVSKSGDIEGKGLQGKIEFHANSSRVTLSDVSGFLSGSLESGTLTAQVREWSFQDKAMIESRYGNIDLSLPARFSGEVDVWSVHGGTDLEFPLERSLDTFPVGPQPLNRLKGRIREGGELLRVFSEKGNIRVRKSI